MTCLNLNLPRNTCQWGNCLTLSFRNNSRKVFGTYGTNLQNPTDRICRIYKADEGKILCQVDQSGAEALITAYLCRPGNLRELFIQGINPHVYTALNIFNSQLSKLYSINLATLVGITPM